MEWEGRRGRKTKRGKRGKKASKNGNNQRLDISREGGERNEVNKTGQEMGLEMLDEIRQVSAGGGTNISGEESKYIYIINKKYIYI